MKRHLTVMSLLGLLWMLFLFVVSCDSGVTYNHSGNCADWAEITIDEYIIQNNVWGKQNITNYEQCIYKESPIDNFPVGWHWVWPEPPGGVKAYPEIIYGHKPWSAASTTADLPVQISAITDITAVYDITQTASGSYNLAFDVWLNDTNPPTGESITRELMIWLDREVMVPAGTYQATVNIDGEAYDFYKTEFPDWTYIAFVKQTSEFSGTTRIDLFFDYLVANGHIADTEYCSSIELGNEIVSGSGSTEFANFTVTVN
ncbi:MAG: hypothetical protein JW822_04890 [Spirochaetales bacterium]|nr:hypothetical protein [Spirochaetales bacterium]